MKEKNGFLDQTAKDYDMSYGEVERLYTKSCVDGGSFYEMLGEFIKERANR